MPGSIVKEGLPKSPTGIQGLDEVTGGGFPRGRTTLVCGGPGCGKTLLAMEFIVRGATEFNEPGVFMEFEETAEELAENVASLGFDLKALIANKQLVVDYVQIDRSEIEEAGEYDLEGLFIRLGQAIESIGAKRVSLDTLESLFSGFSNPHILRAELRRLFHWLKAKGVTTVITGESGDKSLTRQGLEEYVSDCVVLLDHRIRDQMSSRRLRIVKYRGSVHGTNEYPFLIHDHGISVVPITSVSLEQSVSEERVHTGIEGLDDMLCGAGFYRGSSVLISGTAGAGKSSYAAHFADAACRRGERALYFSFEESPSQIIRNMSSIGINLASWMKKGLLQFQSTRPTFTGMEMHLIMMYEAIDAFQPQVVIVDPLNSFLATESQMDIKSMFMRLVDNLKSRNITGLFTTLTLGGEALEETDLAISSLIDTWILLRVIETDDIRNRGVYILKSRGMAHSNRIRNFLLTDHGVELVDA